MKLIEVLEVQTYSRQDARMISYLTNEVANIEGATFFMDEGNMYVTKGVAPYPCVVAHTDTVHRITDDLTAVVVKGKITGINAVTMEQTGIGGDDKVGIYVALEMLREFDNIKCFFPRDEEIGCVGSAKVKVEWFNDVTIALQCDRRGNSDFVTQASGTILSSSAFQNDVWPIIERYGYKFTNGLMTDVQELKERGIKASMANISCGYYNPHQETEYVDIADVHKVTLMVSEIIRTLGSTFYPHEIPLRRGFGMSSDVEFVWWNDDRPRSILTSPGLNGEEWCQDCWMKPATGKNGLCNECWDWYKEQTKKHTVVKKFVSERAITLGNGSKPVVHNDAIIRTTNDVKKVVQEWKRKRTKTKKR